MRRSGRCLGSLVPMVSSFLSGRLKLYLRPGGICLRRCSGKMGFLKYIVGPCEVCVNGHAGKEFFSTIRGFGQVTMRSKGAS